MNEPQWVPYLLVNLGGDTSAANTLGIIHLDDASLDIFAEEGIPLIIQDADMFVRNAHIPIHSTQKSCIERPRPYLVSFTLDNWQKTKSCFQ